MWGNYMESFYALVLGLIIVVVVAIYRLKKIFLD